MHRSEVDRLRRSPMGDAGGGSSAGGGGGGSGGFPSQSGVSGPSPKLPNAMSPTSTTAPSAAGAAPEAKPKIHGFSQSLGGGKRHEEKWKRKTNLTGTGATHVRTFYCKLNPESLEYMEQQINEWLDAHPDYEVKQVTTSVGEWTGKIKEPAMIVTVWV